MIKGCSSWSQISPKYRKICFSDIFERDLCLMQYMAGGFPCKETFQVLKELCVQTHCQHAPKGSESTKQNVATRPPKLYLLEAGKGNSSTANVLTFMKKAKDESEATKWSWELWWIIPRPQVITKGFQSCSRPVTSSDPTSPLLNMNINFSYLLLVMPCISSVQSLLLPRTTY